MSVVSKVKKAAVAAGVVSSLAGALLAGTAGSAAAAVPNTFKVCAYGNYTAVGEIPQQGNVRTILIRPGQCAQIPLAGGTTYGNVYGFYNTHPDVQFYVGTASFNSWTGWSGSAEGTTTSPTLRNFG